MGLEQRMALTRAHVSGNTSVNYNPSIHFQDHVPIQFQDQASG